VVLIQCISKGLQHQPASGMGGEASDLRLPLPNDKAFGDADAADASKAHMSSSAKSSVSFILCSSAYSSCIPF